MSRRDVSEDDELVLLFYDNGTAQLLINEESAWASDFDEDFKKAFEDEHLTTDDADDILEYLEDEGYLEPGESDFVAIDVEEVDDITIKDEKDEDDDKDVIEARTQDGKTYYVN